MRKRKSDEGRHFALVSAKLNEAPEPSVVVLLSGGTKSAALAHWYNAKGYRLHAITFFYGQRHKKEIAFARRQADAVLAKHTVFDLEAVGVMLGASALTADGIDVPTGPHTKDNVRAVTVPGLAPIMLSIAYGVAAAEKADFVAYGSTGDDGALFADRNMALFLAFAEMERQVIRQDGTGLQVAAPFLPFNRSQVIELGVGFGVDFGKTWTCYRGGDLHCGTCGACLERLAAFKTVGLIDPAPYAKGANYK